MKFIQASILSPMSIGYIWRLIGDHGSSWNLKHELDFLAADRNWIRLTIKAWAEFQLQRYNRNIIFLYMPVSFLSKSAIFAYSQGLVPFYVCVCLKNCSHRSHLSDNKKCKKITFVDFDICHGFAKIVFGVPDLQFRFQMFKICIIRCFRMLPDAKIMKKICNRNSYMFNRRA